MNSSTRPTDKRTEYKASIWLSMIGGFLAAFNNLVSLIGLGIVQGPIVAFATPFAFALGRFMFPSYPAATLIYLPVVIVSIFTLNFGPPGPYKILFMFGAIFYDFIAYVLFFNKNKKTWKLQFAFLFYPIGLLGAAFLAVKWLGADVPVVKGTWKVIAGFMALFWIVGFIATRIALKVFNKWLKPDIIE